MRRLHLPPVRHTLAVFACVLPLAAVQAQTPSPAPAQPAPDQRPVPDGASGRQNQKIENIHVEDGNATVDEVRYGGQTQSITVKPKGTAPEYEVLPGTGARVQQGQPGQSDAGGNGPRVWNVFKF
ncbi:hypothetical protein WKW79_05975 [Variovorax robiniae]|uniref:DUF2782 domain-containing protein n=1 Tax=Variovorax robiniae TaxID=1836199 RepID=A0ABU8X2Z0_9BURK